MCGSWVNFDWKKEVLRLWIAENEETNFWASVLNEIRNRDTGDMDFTLFGRHS
ncbi:MAG: transposase [Spirochaetaceae bacterium]|jgi:transposase-like protein|nr:transposase [Spirochaetaceae bacterium]